MLKTGEEAFGRAPGRSIVLKLSLAKARYRRGMLIHASPDRFYSASRLGALSFKARLGLLFGIVAPVLSGLIFPTYVAVLPSLAMNRAMLLELQFVACELLVIGWAFRAGMDRNRLWRSLALDVRLAVLVLLAAMFASAALISKYPADALLQSLTQLVHLYFAAAVFHLSTAERDVSEDVLIRPLAAGLAVLAIYTAWRFGFPPDPSAVPGGKIEWSFALPGFISVRYLGTWTGAIAAALAVHLLYRERRGGIGAYHCYFVLAMAMTIWSGTRAGLLGIGAAVVLFLFFRGLPRWRAIALTVLLTGVALALALIFQFDDPAFKLFSRGGGGDVVGAGFTSGRWELWVATVERWRDSPLLGWGTGALFYEVYLGWTHTQPHNAILQFLFSWGLVGAAACSWLFARALPAAHAVAMMNRSTWPLLGMVYALLAMSMVDGALYYPRFVIMIVGGLALILARGTTQEDETSPARDQAFSPPAPPAPSARVR